MGGLLEKQVGKKRGPDVPSVALWGAKLPRPFLRMIRTVPPKAQGSFSLCEASFGVEGLDSAGECTGSILGLVTGVDLWDGELSRSTVQQIEKHWRGKILEKRFDEKRPEEKVYVLAMFPYPSGFLHMGHVKVYGSSDVLARYFRMRGKNVLHPIGWDAFGLPAENAAFERGKSADTWTQKNIANMKSALEELNISFDWDRELATCDSDYYRWTQFLFLQLFGKGLAYRREAYVRWDPVDETVLAEEQVDENGRSWRSGAMVEKKLLRQWFIRTSAFAQSLEDGLKDPMLEGWGDIVDIQRHWIGEVNGTTIDFEVVGENSSREKRMMAVWMRHPEYIDKAKFVAVRSESIWTFGCSEKGLLPLKVKNPFTGDVLPVYHTDDVPFAEGAEVHLGMPELNEEDRNFADSVGLQYSLDKPNLAREEELSCLREKICAEARERGIGGYPTSSKLKDWAISRQRYWGTPIPIVHCKTCGEQPVPEEDLPVRFPKITSNLKGQNLRKELVDWLPTTCPNCGGHATREIDTMDTFVDSSWYYLRFLDPDNNQAAFDVAKVNRLLPVDLYIGGKEHATLHLYYARFMNHFLHSVGLVPHREPFRRFLCQGVVKGITYQSPKSGRYVPKEAVEEVDGEFYDKDSKELVVRQWAKMSKSKHNSVQPRDLIAEHGVDTTRLVVLRCASSRGEVEWHDNLFQDMFKWQRRLWLTMGKFIQVRTHAGQKPEATKEYQNQEFFIFDSRNYYLKKITRLMEEKFEVGVSLMKLQGLTNSLRKCNEDVMAHSVEFERAFAVHIILLGPFAPYFASELWSGLVKAPNRLCNSGEILWDQPLFSQPWPRVDSHYESKSDKISSMITFSTSKREAKLEKKKAKSPKRSPGGANMEEDIKSRRA